MTGAGCVLRIVLVIVLISGIISPVVLADYPQNVSIPFTTDNVAPNISVTETPALVEVTPSVPAVNGTITDGVPHHPVAGGIDRTQRPSV